MTANSPYLANRTTQPAISDLFGAKGRVYLAGILKALPTEIAHMIALQLNSIDQLEEKIEAIERRIAEQLKSSPEMRLLRHGCPIAPRRCVLRCRTSPRRRWPGAVALVMWNMRKRHFSHC